MKQFLSILLVASLLMACCGCGQADSVLQEPVNFYYRTDPANYTSQTITPEKRESAGYEDDMTKLLQLYVKGPVTDGFVNPFPKNVEVKGVSVNSNTVYLLLSEEFAELSHINMTSACACLTLTVLELTQRNRLVITARDDAGNIIYTASMSKDQILLSDSHD